MQKLYYWATLAMGLIPFASMIVHALGIPHPEHLHLIP